MTLGPAGIFSTDDASTDQQQIEAEQGPDPYEDYGAEDRKEHVEPVVRAFAGGADCPRMWWYMEYIPEGAFIAWIETMKKAHKNECGCETELSFGYD